jgi:hypothetical protein
MAEDENLRQFVESYLAGQPIQKPTGKTYKLRYGRTVNLGNYESCRIELEETYDESMPRDKALENLARRIEGYGQLRKKHPDLWVPKAEMEAR